MANTLTWVGGGNNRASNPADWSPALAPKPGDTLSMPAGTLNVSGNDLAGDTLSVPFGASVDINTRPGATLNLAAGPRNTAPGPVANVNLDVSGTLKLTADVIRSNLHASGGTIRFIGTSTFASFNTVLDDNLTGSGTLNLRGGNASGEFMEIDGAVGRGLTFNLSGGAPVVTLQIDRPHAFHAQIELTGLIGHIGFIGIHATKADLHNDILRMFDGRKLVDTVRISGGTDLHLHQTAAGVVLTNGIFSDIPAGQQGVAIPLHTT